MGTTPTSTSTISAAVAPASHRRIGLRSVGRNRATDRDQRGEPDQRQRLRIELTGLDVDLAEDVSAKRASLMARQRSRSV